MRTILARRKKRFAKKMLKKFKTKEEALEFISKFDSPKSK